MSTPAPFPLPDRKPMIGVVARAHRELRADMLREAHRRGHTAHQAGPQRRLRDPAAGRGPGLRHGRPRRRSPASRWARSSASWWTSTSSRCGPTPRDGRAKIVTFSEHGLEFTRCRHPAHHRPRATLRRGVRGRGLRDRAPRARGHRGAAARRRRTTPRRAASDPVPGHGTVTITRLGHAVIARTDHVWIGCPNDRTSTRSHCRPGGVSLSSSCPACRSTSDSCTPSRTSTSRSPAARSSS